MKTKIIAIDSKTGEKVSKNISKLNCWDVLKDAYKIASCGDEKKSVRIEMIVTGDIKKDEV